MFVVRVRPTDHALWPAVFKDERGHPLVGYDFVRDVEGSNVALPKGFPSLEHAPDGREFYLEVSKLASDIVAQLKALAPRRETGPPTPSRPRERIFLAAAPAEDVDDLRDELAALLRAQDCIVVPETNPLDVGEVHECAAEWVSSCDKFVQILGTRYG